jgi:hypothetical protein
VCDWRLLWGINLGGRVSIDGDEIRCSLQG